MNEVIKVYGHKCEFLEFTINGIEATYEDFGEKYDSSPETAEDYSCGNMIFVSKPPTQEILNKYKIKLNEYNIVCDELKDKLSFGRCGWCS